MAKSIRSRRISVAAGALSLALVAPAVAAPESVQLLPAAVAQTIAQDASSFGTRYATTNFWNAQTVQVEDLRLNPGDTIAPTGLATIFRWGVSADEDGVISVTRPRDTLTFNRAQRAGQADIGVRVTPAHGTAYTATLKITVVDEDPGVQVSVERQKLEQRYTTANFWNAEEALVDGLTLEPDTTLEPRTKTIFNWGFRNDGGALTLIRPESDAAFKSGKQDIPVKVTEANGTEYDATLKVTVVDSRTPQAWETSLKQAYDVDFANSNAPKTLDELVLPQGATLEKAGITPPVSFKVSTEDGKVKITPQSTFKAGYYELPVKVNDGTDKFDATLRINAKNPQKSPEEVAGTAAGVLGNVLGGLLGTGGAGGALGALLGGIGGLLGGGGSGGDDGSTGSGAGRLINVVITNNANPTVNVEIKDNGSNNGSNNSAVVTGNANPTVEIKDNGSNNGSNNSAVITNNANPTVEIKDNGSNNSAVITNNANPVITGNANPTVNVEVKDNGNNNGNPLITGNANPVIKDNANSSLGSATGGGITSPRCIVALAGLGLPLAALVPIALAQQVRIPGLEQLAAQAAEVFNNAAAQFNVQPEQITAVAGGAVGAVIALLAAVAVVSCIPGDAAPAAPAKPVETAAPVVETNRPA